MLPPLPARLLHVFVAPGSLFAKLRAEPAWLGALTVGAALVVVAVAAVPFEVYVEAIRARMPAGAPAAARLEDMASVMKVTGAIGAVLFTYGAAFLLAGILLLVFNFLLGGEGSYRQYLAVTAHASVIPAIGAVLMLPLKLVTRDPELTLNLGALAWFLEEGYVLRVLTRLDLFGLWAALVTATGIVALDERRRWPPCAALVVSLRVIWALLLGLLPGPA